MFSKHYLANLKLYISGYVARTVYIFRLLHIRIVDPLLAFFEKPVNSEVSPIFIVGCGHSGTTLMAALLNAHPEAKVITGETFIFRFRNRRQKIQKTITNAASDKRRVVEKTPRHIRYIRRILRLYPNARIIIMMRDGRDVASSIRQRTGHLMRGAARWEIENQLVSCWIGDSRVNLVNLEKLLADPKKIMNGICNFLDLSCIDNLLERHAQGNFDYYSIEKRNVKNQASRHSRRRHKQVNEPLKKYIPRWPKELDSQEASVLAFFMSEKLKQYGYTEDERWKDNAN
jgi:hypothetical protein